MMRTSKYLIAALACGASAIALAASAHAENFNIPGGDLVTALNAYSVQARVALIYPDDALKNTYTAGARGSFSAEAALSRLLKGTGFTTERDETGAVAIVPEKKTQRSAAPVTRLAETQPAHAAASVETVVVTSSKIKGDIQTVPIAITALSQEQLTSRQIAGGPDLVKEVPNLTFTKTNFTGYSIQIRGIGTQAISVTTDPAVAVAFNDIPFIRNHFFEQEFYDVSQVEVVRGPQGTLYGRNATAGVVNLISAKPTDQFEAMLSADWGNYSNRRYEGMVNIPSVDDRLDLRVAGEWTKRDGYTYDSTLGKQVDGRDLWSSRVTVGWKPFENVQTYLVWEHFQEDDDRVRSAKQLCEKDPGPTSIDGYDLTNVPLTAGQMSRHVPADFNSQFYRSWLSQGCLPVSLYSPQAYETPNGQALPFVAAGEFYFGGDSDAGTMLNVGDPYANQAQSRNLRVIESALGPTYRARNDTLEFNADYAITPQLTITSQTGYNNDFLYSTEDFNRFDTAPGLFGEGLRGDNGDPSPVVNGIYCDPQLDCSTALV
ncbi:MAG TPA: TonB-dependent receptor plug domain-containing protein, partial [Rhizomicrobium sp.]|nr:TonB-dependent receptor plug domain-containing protein [Rhizomicrobium sp.]